MATKGSQPETLLALNAFQHFCQLGRKKTPKTFKLVARKAGVHPDSVRRWYKKWKWSTRPDPTEELAKAGDLRGALRKLREQLTDRISKGKITPRSLKDVETVVKIEAILQQKPTGDPVMNVYLSIPRPPGGVQHPYKKPPKETKPEPRKQQDDPDPFDRSNL